jgi:hypothetical protein
MSIAPDVRSSMYFRLIRFSVPSFFSCIDQPQGVRCSMSSGVTNRASATRPPPPGCGGTRSPKQPRPQVPVSSSSSYTSAGPPSSSPGTSSSTSSSTSTPSPSTSSSPPTSAPISCSPAGQSNRTLPPPPPLSSPLPFCHCNSKTPHFAEKIIINPLFCGNMLFRCHSCLLRRSETFSSSYII